MDRRDFLKVAGLAGVSLTGVGARASERAGDAEFIGVLVDTTRCIGCRSCERACSLENDRFVPDVANDNALASERDTSEKQWTVVNRYETSRGEVFVKKQCMHCWQPACAAACLTNAMLKTHEGPVIWRSDKCMGCRFCMVSCPFDIPKFEYDSWNPRIHKCNLCWERLQAGQKPACVEACPTKAITFGDLNNFEHKVSQLIKSPHAFRLLERLGTEPKVYYMSMKNWVRRMADNYLTGEFT